MIPKDRHATVAWAPSQEGCHQNSYKNDKISLLLFVKRVPWRSRKLTETLHGSPLRHNRHGLIQRATSSNLANLGVNIILPVLKKEMYLFTRMPSNSGEQSLNAAVI